MNENDLALRIKNIDNRTTRIEQILPGLATKEDLAAFATKEDLAAFATKAELTFATKDDVREVVRQEGERTRRHFDVVAEQLRTEIATIAEGHESTKQFVTGQIAGVKTTLAEHDRRLMKLEAKSLKQR